MLKENNASSKASVPTNSHALSGKQISNSIYKRTKKVPLQQQQENIGIGDHLINHEFSPSKTKANMPALDSVNKYKESAFAVSGTETTPVLHAMQFATPGAIDNLQHLSNSKTTPKMTVCAFVSGVEQRLVNIKKDESSQRKTVKRNNLVEPRSLSGNRTTTRISANKQIPMPSTFDQQEGDHQKQTTPNAAMNREQDNNDYLTPIRIGASFAVDDVIDLERTGTTAKNDDRSASISFGHEHLKEIVANKNNNVVLSEKENPMGMAIRHLGRGFSTGSSRGSGQKAGSGVRGSSDKGRQLLGNFVKRSIRQHPVSTKGLFDQYQKKNMLGAAKQSRQKEQLNTLQTMQHELHAHQVISPPGQDVVFALTSPDTIDHFYQYEESVNLHLDCAMGRPEQVFEKNTDLDFLMNPVTSPDTDNREGIIFQSMEENRQRRSELADGWQILTIDPKVKDGDFFGQPISFRPKNNMPISLTKKESVGTNSRQHMATSKSLVATSHRKEESDSNSSSQAVAVSTSNLCIPKILEQDRHSMQMYSKRNQHSSTPLNLETSSQFTMDRSSCRTPDALRRKRAERKSSRGAVTPCQANVQYALLAQNTLRRAIYRRLKHSHEPTNLVESKQSPRKDPSPQKQPTPGRIGRCSPQKEPTPGRIGRSSGKKVGLARTSSKKSFGLQLSSSRKNLIEQNANLKEKMEALQHPIMSQRSNSTLPPKMLEIESTALIVPIEITTFREQETLSIPLEAFQTHGDQTFEDRNLNSPIKLSVNIMGRQESSFDHDATLLRPSPSIVKTSSPSLMKTPSPSPYRHSSRNSTHSSPLKVMLQPIGLCYRNDPSLLNQSPLKNPDFIPSAESSPTCQFQNNFLRRKRSSPVKLESSPSKNPVLLLKLQLIKEANCARSIQRAFRRKMMLEDAVKRIQYAYRRYRFICGMKRGIAKLRTTKYNLQQIVEAWRTRRALNCLAIEVQDFVNCEVDSRRDRLRLQFHLLFEQVIERRLYLEKNAASLQRLQKQSNSLLARTYSSTDSGFNSSMVSGMQSQAPIPMQYMNLMPYYESKSSLESYMKNGQQQFGGAITQQSHPNLHNVENLSTEKLLRQNSAKKSVDPVSPMNFSNEQEMLVERVNTSSSPMKCDGGETPNYSPVRSALSQKKQNYLPVQQLIIQEQEEPPSSVYIDQSLGVNNQSQQRSVMVSGNQSHSQVENQEVSAEEAQMPLTHNQVTEKLIAEHERNLSSDERLRSLAKVECQYKAKIKQVRHRVDCWNEQVILRDNSNQKPAQAPPVKPQRNLSEIKAKQSSYGRSRADERLSCFKEAVRAANKTSTVSHSQSPDKSDVSPPPTKTFAYASLGVPPANDQHKNISQASFTTTGTKNQAVNQHFCQELPTQSMFMLSPSEEHHPMSPQSQWPRKSTVSRSSSPQKKIAEKQQVLEASPSIQLTHVRSTSDNVRRSEKTVIEKNYMSSHKSSPQLRPYVPAAPIDTYRVTLERLCEVFEKVQQNKNLLPKQNRFTNGRQSQEAIRLLSLNEAERQFKRFVRDLEDQFDELKLKQIIGE